MRATYQQIADYLSSAAALLERYGVVLRDGRDDLEILEDGMGRLSFELVGRIGAPGASAIEVREEFGPVANDLYERTGYEFELLDRERDHRRAWHMHSTEWFRRTHLVVVHEHCDRPIGHAACQHYEGSPVRDVYAGIVALVDAWTAPTQDCARLRCL
jgi:hypothetical protein